MFLPIESKDHDNKLYDACKFNRSSRKQNRCIIFEGSRRLMERVANVWRATCNENYAASMRYMLQREHHYVRKQGYFRNGAVFSYSGYCSRNSQDSRTSDLNWNVRTRECVNSSVWLRQWLASFSWPCVNHLPRDNLPLVLLLKSSAATFYLGKPRSFLGEPSVPRSVI